MKELINELFVPRAISLASHLVSSFLLPVGGICGEFRAKVGKWGGLAGESQHEWQVAGTTWIHVTHSNQVLSEFTIVLWKDLTASKGSAGS